MRRAVLSCLGALLLAAAAQSAEPMKATAPDEMMPEGSAERMRECDKKALDANVKMEERAAYVTKCMGMK
jgi:hypothetical protein